MEKRKKIGEWLGSPTGQKAVAESLRVTDEVVAELQKSRQVTREILERPFGPADGGRIWPHQRNC